MALWPDAAFKRLIEILESDAGIVKHPTAGDKKIKVFPEFRDRGELEVGRFPGGRRAAPGGNSAIVDKSAPRPNCD